MCTDFNCPYRNDYGQCALTACIKPKTYTTNATVSLKTVKRCPHCGQIVEYWYEEVEPNYAKD